MEKKQIIKNKIVSILASFVMVLSLVLIVPAEVDASVFLDHFTVTPFEENFTFYGSLDNSTVHPFHLSRGYYFGDYDLTLGKSYLVVMNMPMSTGASYEYTPDKAQISFERYLRYGGELYNFNDSYIACIVDGNSTRLFSYVVDGNLTLNPYRPGDGYIYANSCNLIVKASGTEGYMYELLPEEVPEARGFIEKFNSLISILTDIKSTLASEKALLDTYLPKLNEIEYAIVNHIMPNVANIETATDTLVIITNELLDVTNDIYNELIKVNSKLDINNDELSVLNGRMVEIHEELIALHETLKNQTSGDKSETDSLKENSDSQSVQLNNLNQQSQTDKIDVDNASGVVDQNLNINTDANYGVLLSTFTSNGKILTMLLAVSSIGLISYVLFGKR